MRATFILGPENTGYKYTILFINISLIILLCYSFGQLGGTSLDAMALINTIKDLFHVQLKVEDLLINDSLGYLCDLIIEAGQNRSISELDDIESCVPMRVNSEKCDQTLYLIHPGDGHIQVHFLISWYHQ